MITSERKKLGKSDKVFYGIIDIIMFISLVLILVPLLNVISSSISEPSEVLRGRVFILPEGFSLDGYKAVFKDNRILSGYANTIIYTGAITILSVIVNIMLAYPLSRQDLVGVKFFTFLLTFTMLFSGGIIPSYILMRDLHLIDTRWSIILPSIIGAYNVIIAKTFFQSTIPKELLEAAQIDGCNNIKFIWSVVLPLSKAIVAVLALYYGVAAWNSWFNAYLYLGDIQKYPLQLVLKEILFGNSTSAAAQSGGGGGELDALSESIKYACIMVSCIPVWCIFPFVQKHFVKGVMIGSIKG